MAGHAGGDVGATERESPYVDDGPGCGPPDAVVVDIGGNVGALIVYTSAAGLGQELDLTPAGAPRSHHTHTMVRRRRLVGRDVFAGVYPELVEGAYTLWGHDGRPLAQVDIVGATVTEIDASPNL